MGDAASLVGEPEVTGDGSVGSTGSDAFLRELADIGSAPAVRELPAGTRVDRFEIVGVIGRGGMGVVYDALDGRLGRHVALKLLHSHQIGEADRRARFTREAKAAAAITHPNVARILEVGDGESGAYLVFEKVSGATLRAKIRASPLPTSTLMDLGAQIARGLAAAHAAGVVHRDLKPENVIIDERGDVKILDFGLAKTSSPSDATSDVLTADGIVLGSPGYMSPEQALGKAMTSSTDLFSLGVVLFEIATGKRPFQGSTAMEAIVATTRDAAPDPCQLRRDLPRAFGRLVQGCLAKDSGRRPTALEVEVALVALRHRAPMSRGGIAAVVALVVAVVGLVAFVMRARPPAPSRGSEHVTTEPASASAPTPVALTAAPFAPSARREPLAPPTAVSTTVATPRVDVPGAPRSSGIRVAPTSTTTASATEPALPKAPRPDDPSFAERK